MKRQLWNQALTKHTSPAWPCPMCFKGTLSLVPKSLIYNETIPSKRSHSEENWDPDWIEYVFTAWVKCGHASCGQEFAISGVGGEEPLYEPEEGMQWTSYFAPRFCSPMPNIFEIPQKCPKEVSKELRSSFVLFWSDHAASANRVRIALERLMDHLGVQKKRKDKHGKLQEISLHQRIDIFSKGEPAIGKQLMALKWLGNTGSHEGQVSREDVLDAFEILEHALAELIERRTERVNALAKKLIKKHAK